nr:MAG TPA: hypothetical protein [Caudoviricetes sp.]
MGFCIFHRDTSFQSSNWGYPREIKSCAFIIFNHIFA